MIILDTSVWIEFFKNKRKYLQQSKVWTLDKKLRNILSQEIMCT